MPILETIALGGLLLAGGRTLLRLRTPPGPVYEPRPERSPAPPPEPERRALALDRSHRDLGLSGAALGLAVAGAAWRLPLFGLASLVPVLLVFRPTFGEALASLRQRRVDIHVLDAVRLSVCTVMGYTIIAGLNALLHAWSQRLLLRSEAALSETLKSALGAPAAAGSWLDCEGAEVLIPAADIRPGQVLRLRAGDVVAAAGEVQAGRARLRPDWTDPAPLEIGPGDRLAAGRRLQAGAIALRVTAAAPPATGTPNRLEAAASGPTPIRWVGERCGAAMAPWMLGAFALSLPVMGVSRAASFLTTSFGAQMSRLGPYNARQFIGLAAEAGILIREPRALELANLVNTIIFDAEVLADPGQWEALAGLVHALRQRRWPAAEAIGLPFTVFVMTDDEARGAELADALGLDGYFAASGEAGAALIESLQANGRLVCHVGRGRRARPSALLSCAAGTILEAETSAAQVFLLERSLRGLLGLFELAPVFAAKQKFNLTTPITADLIDISTTIFLHCGLIYSLLFSYSGYFLGLAGSRPPRRVTVAQPAADTADARPPRELPP